MNEHAWAKARLYEFIAKELPDNERQTVEKHLASCRECREEMESLSLTIQEMDRATVDWSNNQSPEYWKSFANSIEERIGAEEGKRKGIVDRFREWFGDTIIFRPRDIALASAVCAVVLVALIIGKERFWKEEPPKTQASQQAVTVVDSDYIRLHDYFHKSQTLLVGLANMKTDDSGQVDLHAERVASRNLLKQTRFLKQQPMDTRSKHLIGDMEKILLNVANSGNELPSPELEIIRGGIERQNLLYKVRKAEASYSPRQFMLVKDKEH